MTRSCVLLWCTVLAAVRVLPAQEEVLIPSSLDGVEQRALLDIPPGTNAVPLLVHLHSWSATYNSSGGWKEALDETRRRGWVFLSPDFRGPNDRPEACASDLAVQDVLDAVAFAFRRAKIDPRRVYVAGGSGGGHMTLTMAHRAPSLWAAASAWVPITDLAAWHRFSAAQDSRYHRMLEKCTGGPPNGEPALLHYRRRSPLFHLGAARGLPIDIQAGIRDGHDGSVPVRHSLEAFNELARANGAWDRQLPPPVVEAIATAARVPEGVASEPAPETGRKHAVLFRRSAGPARLTLFDGGHATDLPTAIQWLEAHTNRRAGLPVLSGPTPHRVYQREAGGGASLRVSGVAAEAGTIESRFGEGPWRELFQTGGGLWEAVLPLRSGGPYTIELRLMSAGAERGFARFEELLVGDLWVLAGQSNMVGRAELGRHQELHPLVKVLAPEGGWRTARDPLHEHRHYRPAEKHGAGLGLAFAKEMLRRTGVPVGLIPVAVGGTSLEQWNPGHKGQGRLSLYGNMLSRFRVAGGRVAGMLWYQGEADTRTKNLGTTYGERFARFVASTRADFGQPDLPVYFAQLSRYGAEPGEGYQAWDEVQEAQRRAETEIAHSGVVGTVDLDLGDPIHLDRPSLERLGLRFARRVLDGPGPRLEEAVWLAQNKLRVRLSGAKGTLDVGPRATGFSLSGADGSPRLLLYRGMAEQQAIVFDVADSRADEPLYLWYGRGLDPPAFVRDAHDNALPAFGPVALPPRPR